MAMTAEHPYGGMLSARRTASSASELGAGRIYDPPVVAALARRGRPAAPPPPSAGAARPRRMRASRRCSRSRSRSAQASSGEPPTSSAGSSPAGSRSRPCWSCPSWPGSSLLAGGDRVTGAFDARAFAVGLAAGVFGAVGIAAFYRALATGTISIVSPVSACGALVPVVLALAQGERPGAARAGRLRDRARRCGARVGARVRRRPPRRAQLGAARGDRRARDRRLPVLHRPRGRAAATRCPPSWAAAAPRSPCSWPACWQPAARCACRRAEIPAVAGIGLLDVGANALFAAAAPAATSRSSPCSAPSTRS